MVGSPCTFLGIFVAVFCQVWCGGLAGEHAKPASLGYGFELRAGIEGVLYGADVVAHRLFGDVQVVRDLPGGLTFCHEAEHLELAAGQVLGTPTRDGHYGSLSPGRGGQADDLARHLYLRQVAGGIVQRERRAMGDPC